MLIANINNVKDKCQVTWSYTEANMIKHGFDSSVYKEVPEYLVGKLIKWVTNHFEEDLDAEKEILKEAIVARYDIMFTEFDLKWCRDIALNLATASAYDSARNLLIAELTTELAEV